MTPLAQVSTERIAIQGVKGAFHEIAARKFFGPAIELEECMSFPDLFQAMDEQRTKIGVVAIENTLAGTILPNYALLRNSTFNIMGEIYLRIEHQLCGIRGGKIADLREVFSHPMAIEQCRQFFKDYPHIRLVESEDTAGSAEMVNRENNPAYAAIASELAAKHYQLDVLARNIETNPFNYTRFWIIAEEVNLPNLSKINKASLCFNLKHQVGSLSQILLLLGGHGMNLTKIQSLPIVGKAWQYFFHIDLEFDDYEQYQRAIASIQFQVDELKILGEYTRGEK
ncbi:MAG: prephenate dehydratase [Bacteroidota bacterium]